MKFYLYILAFTLISFQLHAKNKSPESPKIAYLGVYASKVNPNVSHQLKLSRNLYLSVERVEKGSPAEKAGIQQFDILLQLDDQILINPDQLKYLVRSKKPKDEVSLHFLSRGDKKNTTLVLGGIIQPIEDEFENTQSNNRLFSNRDPFDMDRFFSNQPEFQELLRRHRSDIGQSLNFNRNKGRFRPMPPKKDLHDDPLHQNPTSHSSSQKSSHSQVMVTDEEGTLEWTEQDGQKSLRATDPNGKVLFDGPIDTAKEKSLLSKKLKSRLEKLESQF